MNFAEGDVYFLGPMFPHYFFNEKQSGEAEPEVHFIAVQFREDFLGKELLEKPEFGEIKKLLRLVQSSGLKITTPNRVTEQLFHELSEPGIKKVLLLLRLLDRLATLPDENIQVIALHYYENTDSHKDFSKLDPVYHYVLENFQEDVNSRKAASLAFLNEAAFCRYFKDKQKKLFHSLSIRYGSRMPHHCCRIKTRALQMSVMNVDLIIFLTSTGNSRILQTGRL